MNPIKTIDKGFVSCYLVFFLFIPFLNILVQRMSEKQHRLLSLLLLGTYTLTASIPYIHVTMNYVTWFCVLYIYASYMRFYLSNKFSARFWGLASLASIVLSMLSVYACLWFGKDDVYFFVADSNKILALVTAVCTFNWFRLIRIRQSKLINTISASTFGVLIIHANSDTMRQWLWKEIVDCCGHADDSYYAFYALGAVLAIYVVCTVIDQLRIRLLEKYYLPYTIKFLSRFLP